MIFRRNKVRPLAASALKEVAFLARLPRDRLVAVWRRDQVSGHLRVVWKDVGELNGKPEG